MSNIVEQFKKNAKDLSELYKARKKLNQMILDYETKLRDLGKVLEFADCAEAAFKSENTINKK